MKQMLYKMYSKIDGFKDSNGVYLDIATIHWFVTERSAEAYAEYQKILKHYLSKLDPSEALPSLNSMSTYFTEKECDQFEKQLSQTKGWTVGRVEKPELIPKEEVTKRSIARRRSAAGSNVAESFVDVFDRNDCGNTLEVRGRISPDNAVPSQVQDLRLELKIDRTVMIDLLPIVNSRISDVAKMIQKAVDSALHEKVGKMSTPVTVDCDELREIRRDRFFAWERGDLEEYPS